MSSLNRDNKIIKNLLKIRESIIDADNDVITDTLWIKDSQCETVVDALESQILTLLNEDEREYMEEYFELTITEAICGNSFGGEK